jgi:lipoprotein-anchoring transpeptidase ErfK/SrfK
MRCCLAAFIALVLLAEPAAAVTPSLDVAAVNDAQWGPKTPKGRIHPVLIKAQVLLDRARFSPGEIDGKPGENLDKAAAAFAKDQGLNTKGLTEEVWQKLIAASQDPILTDYVITDDDVRGPFAEKIPAKMEDMQDLPALSYRNAREKIAEAFHMSEELLSALNPGQKFERAGETIVVANVATGAPPAKAARVEIDKSAQTLQVFDRSDKLIAFFPVTIGSPEKPAPSGRLKVTGVRKNPTYRYNPEYAFKGVRATKPFTIKPGPNNPVGAVWIGLSAQSYGIHGTPEPSKVSKSESHGCVRLTNWDALRLASAVGKGTPVDFIGNEQAAREARAQALKSRRPAKKSHRRR